MTTPFDYSINVTTTPFSNGVIEQEVKNISGQMTRYICDTQDQQIRQALMQLGWLPPEEVEKLKLEVSTLEDMLAEAQDQIWNLVP